MDQLLDVRDLATAMKVSKSLIYRKHAKGEDLPPATDIGGGLLRWRREDVVAWLEQRRDPPTRATTR